MPTETFSEVRFLYLLNSKVRRTPKKLFYAESPLQKNTFVYAWGDSYFIISLLSLTVAFSSAKTFFLTAQWKQEAGGGGERRKS